MTLNDRVFKGNIVGSGTKKIPVMTYNGQRDIERRTHHKTEREREDRMSVLLVFCGKVANNELS
jgi:hypothetical protein